MEDETYVEAGKLFCFSTGKYSDFGYEGHFLALVPLTRALFQSVVDEIKAEISEGIHDRYGDKVTDKSDNYEKESVICELFTPRLIRRGAVMDIDCTEIHKSAYSRLEIPSITTYGY